MSANKQVLVREMRASDVERIAEFEKEIAEISFGDEAISDLEFHSRKLQKAMQKELGGMLVLEHEGDPVGWLWMTSRENFHTGETYVNFKSFALDPALRGGDFADRLLEAGMEYCRKSKARRVVGHVHVNNLAMRVLYKKHGFQPTHLTMEIELEG